jgi:hypothetical protein
MKFFSNKIVNPTGPAVTFDAWLLDFMSTANQNKQASCGKEMGESKDAGKPTKHTPASPGNDENKNPKILINNDPHYQKGESVSGKKKSQTKKKTKNKAKKADTKFVFKKISSLTEDQRLELFKVLASNENNVKLGSKNNKIPTLMYVEAMTNLKFSNLNEKQKNKLVEYFKILYPEDFVKEMVKDR